MSIQIEGTSLVDEIQDLARKEVSGEPITLSVPFEIKRRGREVRLVVTGGSPDKESVSSLLRAVAIARDWAERIAAGEIVELDQLAREYGIERSYARKVLRCVALSPQNVEAILTDNMTLNSHLPAQQQTFHCTGIYKGWEALSR